MLCLGNTVELALGVWVQVSLSKGMRAVEELTLPPEDGDIIEHCRRACPAGVDKGEPVV